MRGGADESTKASSSPSRATNGTSSTPFQKAALSHVLNGSPTARRATSNGTSPNHANGTHSSSSSQKFFGHDREEVTRILIQGLADLGYQNASNTLCQESGYELETTCAAAFRAAVVNGDWNEAEALVKGTYVSGKSDQSSQTQEQGSSLDVHYDRPAATGLLLAQGASREEMLFLIGQQKYLELLERRDLGQALMVLRQELQPLHYDERQLHSLSTLMMCQTTEELKHQARWDGALGDSRRNLLTLLSRSISPSAMIPEHRLAELLAQLKESRVLNCPYHNNKEWPSLYDDHSCEPGDFPLTPTFGLDRHTDEVWYIAFSNDGTRLVTASKDGTALIYETETFKVQHALKDHTASVAYAAWSPDDSRLLTCSHDKTAKLWNTMSGKCMLTLKYHAEPVSTAAWAPDGKSFVTGSLDKNKPLAIWDYQGRSDAQPAYNFEDTCDRVQECAISAVSASSASMRAAELDRGSSTAQNVRLVTICTTNIINVFDYLRREKLRQINLEHQITSINLSSDGLEMLVNLSCSQMCAIGVEDGAVRRRFAGQKQGQFVIRGCFGGATEGVVVSGSEDGKLYIWHRHSARLLERLDAHNGKCINACAWNLERPRMFATAGDDNKVTIWSNGEPRRAAHYETGSNGWQEESANEAQASLPNWASAGTSFR